MTSPVGENTFRGLALPAQGEWEQVQQNSSNTMVTLTHSTANAGAFLAGRDSVSSQFWGPGSSARGGEVSLIDADGGYQAVSGTTILIEVNSSVIEGRPASTISAWSLDSSGRMLGQKRNVINITTATTTYTAISSLSGSLLYWSSLDTSGQNLLLPSNASSLTIGVYFDVYIGTHAATAFLVTSTAHSSAEILLYGSGASTVSTALAIGIPSTAAGGLRITAISTLQWLGEPKLSLYTTVYASTGEYVVGDFVGNWSTIAPIA